jgi:hypothetical protein
MLMSASDPLLNVGLGNSRDTILQQFLKGDRTFGQVAH